jgi:hypothetical protein
MDSVIPPDVKQFILDRIDSIAQLEALLLLRSTPDTWWDDASLAQRLYVDTEGGQPILNSLTTAGLLLAQETENGQRWRYRPQSGDLREMVDRLAYYYSKHLVPVSNLVHAKPKSRIQEFARAFDLPKDKG